MFPNIDELDIQFYLQTMQYTGPDLRRRQTIADQAAVASAMIGSCIYL